MFPKSKFRMKKLTLFQLDSIFRDADWETDGRFADQAQQHHKCEMPECLSKDEEGRYYHEEGTDWEIIICQFCGGYARHITCANLTYSDTDNGKWSCDDCNINSGKSLLNAFCLAKILFAVADLQEDDSNRNAVDIAEAVESLINRKSEPDDGCSSSSSSKENETKHLNSKKRKRLTELLQKSPVKKKHINEEFTIDDSSSDDSIKNKSSDEDDQLSDSSSDIEIIGELCDGTQNKPLIIE